jgi:hypothetical protein
MLILATLADCVLLVKLFGRRFIPMLRILAWVIEQYKSSEESYVSYSLRLYWYDRRHF